MCQASENHIQVCNENAYVSVLELSSDEDEQMPDGDEIDDDNEPGMTGECDQSSDDDIYENKDVETNDYIPQEDIDE